MRRLSILLLSLSLSAICLASLGTTAVQAETQTEPTIDKLAAATSSTVFARTYYYDPYTAISENGSWWYRDGNPYPGNQGGWGFSDDASTTKIHWADCSDGGDTNGLCFRSGDPNSNLVQQPIKVRKYCTWDGSGTFDKFQGVAGGGGVAYTCWNYGYGTVDDTCLRPNWCPLYWYKLVDSYTEVWQNGSDDFIQAGGTLGGVNSEDAYRVFFSSDNPTYYPSGPQSNVPLDQIYSGGWSLCWVGKYSDSRTAVSEIKASCNQKYVIMAGSITDPHQRQLPLGEIALTGLQRVNQQIKAEPNNWVPGSIFEYQWLRDGGPIANATAASYAVTLDDYRKAVSVRVSVSKPGYLPVAKASAENLIGGGTMSKADIPSLSGDPVVSGLLTASPEIWDSGVSFVYQWLRDGINIPAATSSTYTLQSSDYLKKISVAVTGSKEGYISETKTSNPVIPVKLKEKVASLRFTGTFKVGEKANVAPVNRNGQFDYSYVPPVNRNGKFDYSYQWLRDGVEIDGANSRTYLMGAEDAGANLSARVCSLYLKDVTHCVTQDAGNPVQLGVLKNVKANFSGVAKVGRMIISSPVIFDKQATDTYQWLRNGQPIVGATRNSYFIDLLDKGSSISLRVTVTKPGYETQVKTSNSRLIN